MNALSKKRAALLVISMIVCAALFGAYFIIRHYQQKKPPVEDDDQTVGRLIDMNTADNVSALEISNESGKFSIYRSNGEWHFYGHPNLPIDDAAVTRIINELEYVVSLRDLSESDGSDLEQYGLDDPSRTVSLTCSGEKKTYYFGSPSPYYSGYYFTGINQNVYIVAASLYEIIGVSLEDMLSIDKMPVLTSSTKLVFTDINNNEYIVGKDDKLYDALLTLGIDRYVDYGRENYTIYGFENTAVLAVDGVERLRFCIGESDELVYMLIDDSEMIYLIKSDDLETIVNCIRDVTSSAK